jgi:hypothetical protein
VTASLLWIASEEEATMTLWMSIMILPRWMLRKVKRLQLLLWL